MRITNRTRAVEICRNAEVARTFWSRLVGLLGRRSLESGGGLVIEPCRSVHMMFMRFPIDVIYIDRTSRVVKVVHNLRPFRASAAGRGAHAAIELAAGVAAESGTAVGDQLVLEDLGR